MASPSPRVVEFGPAGGLDWLRQLDAIVVLPTLNEKDGLAQTFSKIPLTSLAREGHRVGAVIIDGGSTDGTLDVARGLGLTILHQSTRGKGMAVREALRWVDSLGVPFALVMDADCTYPPEMIGPSLTLLKAGGQLVVGVRNPVQIGPLGARDIVHRVGNALLNWMASNATGQSILDLCSGFYALDLRTGLTGGLTAAGFEIESELFIKAHRAGLRVVQIPIAYRSRVGEAKLRAFHDGARIFVAILRAGRATPPGIAETPHGKSPLVRELLSACFVHGSRELILLTHPDRMSEANRLVTELEGSSFGHARIVPTWSPTPISRGETPGSALWPGIAVLTLGASERGAPDSGPMAMYLPNTRRAIRLDFDPELLSGSQGKPEPEHDPRDARSGGRRELSRTTRYLRSISTLGSTLDASGFEKEMLLHGANGLKGTKLRTTDLPVSSEPSYPFGASEDRSTS